MNTAPVRVVAGIILVYLVRGLAIGDDTSPLSWPEISNEARPWAYWHWMASAVDEANLARELRLFSEAGLGGMHIIPIYGARGWESRYVPFLAPRWMELLRATVTESRRLGMDVDMTTGTGWNFGGPNVTADLSCLRLWVKTAEAPVGRPLPPIADRRTLVALLAESPAGESIDVTDLVATDGKVGWSADGPGWRLRIVTFLEGSPEVERAAPGGEGPMLNPFCGDAIRKYLERFTQAFASYEGPRPRAMYHDSYEYSGCAWSQDLPAEFSRRRGYRLESHRAALFGSSDDDIARRVRCDFRETLSNLVLDALTRTWTEWSRRHGFRTRNEAHGSPGNLLDLYAEADIPETEMFHRDRDILVAKFASSAAHVAGRRLVAAETGTWLAEHFTETLGDMKRVVDELFLAGTNHVFYHGSCYSPEDAAWPGWLFYASTQMNPRNSIWRDVPALNAYVARCQSILQSGEPDADILLYWPIHDLWHGQKALVEQLTVHRRAWFHEQAIGAAARRLWARGYDFDYVSDRQLAAARVDDRDFTTPGGRYRAVVIPRCERMPLETLRGLLAAVREGATVIFEDRLPGDVPGLGDLPARRLALRTLIDDLRLEFTAAEGEDRAGPAEGSGVARRAIHGRGAILVGDLEAALQTVGISRESLADRDGLVYVRRRTSVGRDYLIHNGGSQPLSGWIPVAMRARSAGLLDPMSARAVWAPTRPIEGERIEAFVELEPGETVILRALSAPGPDGIARRTLQARGAPVPLEGSWQVRFIEGGPDLPAPFSTGRLGSWTEWGGEAAERFAGTARYTLSFDAPQASGPFRLDLGRVAQSARVRLNGRDLGTLILEPFRVRVDGLKPVDNALEVEVTSTSANRIRDLDRRRVPWKIFRDINFVNIDYKPFDASGWPVREAGLLGPVTLQPLAEVDPLSSRESRPPAKP